MYKDQNKAQARLLKDAPHENSKAPKDYDFKEPVVHNDDIENPVQAPVASVKGAPKVVEEKEEVVEARRMKRK